jgi:hypothetical protein
MLRIMILKDCKIFVFCTLFTFAGMQGKLLAQEPDKHIGFRMPLDIPMLLSGNFGEIRSAHLHTGIDIKTQQEIGKKVFAVYDGYISRINIQSGAYGKSLYITHTNGYISVYAHLSKFLPEIEQYVKSNQYQRKRYEVNLFPDRDRFVIKRGQLIAYSGNTGRSSGPHLHFEIRNALNQHPLNVLGFDFNIKDNIKPKIYSLAVYPVDSCSLVNGQHSKLIVPVKGGNGLYSVPDDININVSGKIGFGVEAFDYLDGSNNRCAVYSIDLYIGDTLIYSHRLDELSFNEMRYVNSHADYEEKTRNSRIIHKLWLEPNNKLGIYRHVINRGIYEFYDDTLINIKIIVKDVKQNGSQLLFSVRGEEKKCLAVNKKHDPDFVKPFYYNMPNEYQNDEVKLFLPPGALYDNIDFRYSRIIGDTSDYSGIHYIHDEYTALHKEYTLSIKAKDLPEKLQDKALIVYIEKDTNYISMGGNWENGYVTTSLSGFGKFKVAADTTAPVISPLTLNNNSNHTNGNKISFKITDELSGINTYNGYIDNKWALFEYDAKSNTISYFFDPERITKNSRHTLEIVVTDYKNNIGTYNGTFYY